MYLGMQTHASERLKDSSYLGKYVLLNLKYLQTSNMKIIFSNFTDKETKG